MKYLISLSAATFITLLAYASPASAATPPDSCFAFNAGTGTITDYYDHEANNPGNPECTRDVDIPSTIGGVPVVTIGPSAFYNNQLSNVSIPSSVTSIGSTAFWRNQLTSVTIPDSVTSLGTLSFRDNLLTSVTLSSNVAVLPSAVFQDNELSSIVIPSAVTTIGSYAFADNDFSSFTFASNITSIGPNIFFNNQLASVTIENAAATMDHASFVGNPISSITIGATTYSEQQPTTETACFSVSGSTVNDYYQASPLVARDNGVLCGRDVVINEGITAVGDDALVGNQLTSVVFPSTLTTIGFNSFAANNLSSLVIPDSVTFIDEYAFFQNQLTNVQLPQNITTLPWGVFESNQLTTIDIPPSVITIGEYAFANNQLQEIDFPSGLTSIGDGAFFGNRLTSIVIPDGITTIENESFNCNLLESVTLPANLTSIGSYAFWNNRLQSVGIPSTLSSIGTASFARQSPFGCDLWDELAAIPERMVGAYESIYLTKFYTENQENPQNLEDTLYFMTETSTRDYNGNGVFSEKLLAGGYLLNPASATINYVDSGDESLQQARTFSGQLEGDYLANYNVALIEDAIVKPAAFTATPDEIAAYRSVLAETYYRLGDSVTIEPPAISGYITPEPQTFVLGAADNTFSYVYTQPTSPDVDGSGEGELADTGISMQMLLISATILILSSIGVLYRQNRSMTMRQPFGGFKR